MIKENEIPEYYKGKNGYMAKDVIYNFDLNYNIGTAVAYLLRCKNKHNDNGVQDIRKAINHLHFELDQIIKNEPKNETRTGGLYPNGKL
jgi:hypothetical protein